MERRLFHAKRWLEHQLPAIEGQHGDDLTFQTCRQVLYHFSLAPEEAIPLLREWNLRCSPPWEDQQLWDKLSRAQQYIGTNHSTPNPVESPGSNSQIWLPRETSPEQLPDEKLSALRGRQLEAKRKSLSNPGLYLDRSPTGTGKTTSDLKLLQEVRTPSTLVVPTHENCQEVVKEAREKFGLPARSYPQLSTKEKTIDCQFCGMDPPGRPDPDCQHCAGSGVILNYVSCMNEEAKEAEKAGLMVATAVCPTCDERDWCNNKGYHAHRKLIPETPVVLVTHRRVAVRGFQEVARDRQFLSIHEDPREVLCPQMSVPVSDLKRANRVVDVLLNDPALLNLIWAKEQKGGSRRELDRSLRALSDLLNEIIKAFESADRRALLISLPKPISRPAEIDRIIWIAAKRAKVAPVKNAFRPLLAAVQGQVVSLVAVSPSKRSIPSLASEEASFAGALATKKFKRRHEEHPFLLATFRNELPSGTPVWLSDATANPSLIELLAGKSLEDVISEETFPNLHTVTQYPTDVTRSTSEAVVRSFVRGVLLADPRRQNIAIICHHNHVEAIEQLELIFRKRIKRIDYFGSGKERGSNEHHRNCDFLLILGTPRVPEEQVISRLIQKNDFTSPNIDGDWGAISWMGQTTDGSEIEVDGYGYRQEQWSAAHRSVVRANLVQAVGRARAHLSEGVPCTVFSNEDICCQICPKEQFLALTDRASTLFHELLGAHSLLEKLYRECALGTAEIAEAFGLAIRQTQIRLKQFQELGILEDAGERGRYRLTPTVLEFLEAEPHPPRDNPWARI